MADVSLSPQSTVGNRGRGCLVVSFTRLVCTGLHQPLQDVPVLKAGHPESCLSLVMYVCLVCDVCVFYVGCLVVSWFLSALSLLSFSYIVCYKHVFPCMCVRSKFRNFN